MIIVINKSKFNIPLINSPVQRGKKEEGGLKSSMGKKNSLLKIIILESLYPRIVKVQNKTKKIEVCQSKSPQRCKQPSWKIRKHFYGVSKLGSGLRSRQEFFFHPFKYVFVYFAIQDTSFYCASLYCALQILCFFANWMWQSFIKQVYWHHVSNSIC